MTPREFDATRILIEDVLPHRSAWRLRHAGPKRIRLFPKIGRWNIQIQRSQPFLRPMNVRSAPVTTPQSNAVQEAQETAAQTRKEAASGDQQAVRKLAAAKEAQASHAVVNATPPTTGQLVKVEA